MEQVGPGHRGGPGPRRRSRPAASLFGLGAVVLITAVWPAEPAGPPRAAAGVAPTADAWSAPDRRVTPRVSAERAPRQRGVALGLFAEDVSFSYAPLLREIAELGASHVALIVPLYQEHGGSTRIHRHTRYSPTLETIADTIRQAHREDLAVTLFPIVRLLAPRSPDEWRGTLAPADRAAWFASYGDALADLAALATMTGAARLVVGSELSSLDGDLASWQPLLARVRGLFSGRLVYSANWDHYRHAALLDLVDEAGVTAYFALRGKHDALDPARLLGRWRALRSELEAWAGPRGQPFVFTEVGYRSRAGATAEPWSEAAGGTPSEEEQAAGFEAFFRTWASAPSLHGFYVWNWYGYGGPGTTSYTPRGKVAAEVVRRLLTAP